MAAPHPGAAKALGRQVRGFDEQRRAEHRFDVAAAGNMAKFGQRRQPRDFLAGTGSRVLAEACPRDRAWGIGLAADGERAGSRPFCARRERLRNPLVTAPEAVLASSAPQSS